MALIDFPFFALLEESNARETVSLVNISDSLLTLSLWAAPLQCPDTANYMTQIMQ